MGGTSTRPDGRVDAYPTIDTQMGPDRMKTTEPDQESSDAWLCEARYLASRGAFASHGAEYPSVGEFVGRWLEDEVRLTARAITFAGLGPCAGSSRMPERTGSRLRREMSGRIGSSMGKR